MKKQRISINFVHAAVCLCDSALLFASDRTSFFFMRPSATHILCLLMISQKKISIKLLIFWLIKDNVKQSRNKHLSRLQKGSSV